MPCGIHIRTNPRRSNARNLLERFCVTCGDLTTPLQIRFNVSKLSAVEVKVLKAGKVVFTRLATFRRGDGSFAFTPHSGGTFRVQLAAKELRTGLGKRDRTSGAIEVAP